MRRSFAFGVLLAWGLILGAAFFLKQHFKPVSPRTVAVTESVPAPNPAPVVSPSSPPDSVPAPVFTPAPAKTSTLEQQQMAVNAEEDRLSTWEWNNDPQSLSNILADLKSPDKEIRMAAISAAVQFNSADAIPVLRMTAANDADADEKAALLKAADYLSLPEITLNTGSKR